MNTPTQRKTNRKSKIDPIRLAILILGVVFVVYISVNTYSMSSNIISNFLKGSYSTAGIFTKPVFPKKVELDKVEYDLRIHHLAHTFDLNDATSTKLFKDSLLSTSTLELTSVSNQRSGASSSTVKSTTSSSTVKAFVKSLWPVTDAVYPKVGAILPFNRVVAYYGNLYSKKMGALGEYEPDDVLRRLQEQVKEWEAADPATPVVPALHYIAVVAQGSAGKDGKYRARMPDSEIDKVMEMAKKINALVFLDIQVALSDVHQEVPQLKKYLSLPNVHLGIDPEFSMKNGEKPGSVIGTMYASDINFTASYLAELVRTNDLPPKILTFYRFTKNMVKDYKSIKTIPEVQLVHTMDGWGHQARKIGTYKAVVYPEPIQFTGFKLFYKNDLKEDNSRLMTPSEVLKLTPAPIYIQYQ